MNGSVRRESVSRSSVFAFQQKVIKVNRKSFTQTDIYVSLSGIYDIHPSDNDHDGESSCLIIFNSSSLTQKHQTEKQTLIAKSLKWLAATPKMTDITAPTTIWPLQRIREKHTRPSCTRTCSLARYVLFLFWKSWFGFNFCNFAYKQSVHKVSYANTNNTN